MSREEELFQLALAQPPESWPAFLREHCGADAPMARRLTALLEAHRDGEFMERPASTLPGGAATASVGELAGDTIGLYELVRELGSGAFGSVWMAVQRQPVRRTVALKILKLGMDTREVLTRFAQERETLALMNHPNIARIHDAGATPAGRPFIAMELVRGLSLTRWCDEHSASTRQRLDLFVQVCQAIQHAHQKGIIHRDLKPSNVLVTEENGVPTVKVIDFGVAKATLAMPHHLTLVTHFEQMVGTPLYMSPEQTGLTGQDADTRSDIYALGVLLYELLTGSTPIEQSTLSEKGRDEVRRLIREVDPPRPSQRVKSLQPDALADAAQRRVTDVSRLPLLLDGDLDWIVMRCLEKDRNRRYETANALAMDIGRHLRDEPVLARPPSALYLLAKTVRRHRVMVSSAAVVLTLLLASAVVSSWLAVRSARAEKAELELRKEAEASRHAAERHRNDALLRAYEADMSAAALLLEGNNFGEVEALLARHTPAPGLPDLRGFEWWLLRDRIRGTQVATLTGHRNMVDTVAFSPDGRLLASGDVGGAVHVWDVGSGRLLASPQASDSRIVGVSFSHDGRRLAVGDDSALTLLSVPGFTLEEKLPLTSVRPRFSPVEPLLALGVGDNRWHGTTGETRLWRWQDDPAAASMTVLPAAGTRLDFTADGRTLLTGATGSRLQVWDVATATRRTAFPLPSVLEAAISPTGAWVAGTTAIPAPSPSLWNPATGRELLPLADESTAAVSLAASPADGTLAVGSADQFITLWDVKHRTALRTLHGHRGEVTALAFSRDGQWLASGSMDETVRLWQPGTPPPPDEIGGIRAVLGMAGAHLSPDGSLVAACTTDKLLRLWRTDTLTPHVTLGYGRWALAFSPDGTRLLTVLPRGILELWDTRTGENLGGVTLATRPHLESISSASPDGRIVAICHLGELHFVDTRTGLSVFHATEPRGIILGSAFSPDGTRHVTVSQGGQAVVRQVPSGRIDHVLTGHKQDVRGVAFSPDGKWLATGGHDNRIRIWDLATGAEVAGISGHRQVVNFLAFTPDNRTLVSAGDDREAFFWRVGDWRSLGRHRIPSPVRSLDVSADGSTLAVTAFPRQLAVLRAPSEAPRPLTTPVGWVLDRLPPVSWAVGDVPPRPESLPATCLDLGPFYNARLTDSWAGAGGAECSLAEFPSGGDVELNGVRWDARGVLQIHTRERGFEGAVLAYPESVRALPVQQKVRRLHLLASAVWAGGSPHGLELGRITLRFGDGQARDLPLSHGIDALDWFSDTPPSLPPDFRSQVAWTGRNAASSAAGTTLRLFHVTLENPRPDAPVTTLDLTAVHGCPFFLAITVEP